MAKRTRTNTIVMMGWVQCVLIAIMVPTLVRSQNTFDAATTCAMVLKGTYLKDPAACDRWIECTDPEMVYGTCDSELFYDRNTQECVNADSIKCRSTNPCATIIGDGFVADPNSCNGYYYCYNGKGTRGECSSGLNYNPGTEDCIRNANCKLEPSPNSWCNIIPDGVLFSDPDNCQGYHICINGTLRNGTCPDGYYFRAVDGVCDYKENVVCTVPEKHPNLDGTGICESEGQFVSDNETCAGYYYCKETSGNDFVLIWGECPTGRFFDPTDGGECIDRRQIDCPYNRCEGMGTSGIQLVNVADDGCVGYWLCQDGEAIGSGVCPSSEKYFDEISQRCTSSAITYPSCVSVATTTTSTSTSTTKEANADS